MGRKTQQTHHATGVPQFPGRHPGCMWGVLHVLKYQRWRYIKKRLPQRRPSANDQQHPIGITDEECYEDNDGLKGKSETQTAPQNCYSNQNLAAGDEKPTKSNSSSTRSSVRSRLKSLISDELYRKKGSRHHRSYTCPVPQQQQQQQQEQPQPQFEKPLPLQRPPSTSQVEVNKDGESENHRVHNIDSSKKFDDDDDGGGTTTSKEISNALDMAIMNKEFLATILQDPHSHFAPQFTRRKSTRYYSKSMSFPLTSSMVTSGLKEPPQKQQGKGQSNEAAKTAPKPLESRPLLDSRSYARSRSMSTITAEHRADGVSQLKQSMAALVSTSSSLIKGRRGRNKTAMKCLKDLKQKIRHVITMEAVLHRIPRGGGGGGGGGGGDGDEEKMPSTVSSSLKPSNKREGGKENVTTVMVSPRKSYEGDSCKFLLASKSENQRLKRTSSLCESLDKYCQLYESTFNKGCTPNFVSLENSDAKDDQLTTSVDDGVVDDVVGDRVVTGPITSIDESDVEKTNDDNMVSSTLVADDDSVVMEKEKEKEKEKEMEKKKKKKEEEEQMPPIFEVLVEESNKDLDGDQSMFVVDDDEASISREEAISSPPTFSTFKDSEQILRNLIANKLNFLEDQRAESIIDEIIVAEEEIDEKNEFQSNINQADYQVVEFEVVDPKEKTKFDYVRGILDISGFSGKELLLGTWHSSDQPVDPAVFEEAGVDNCYHHHLAMFDLINQVLMEIYAKSHTYCPKPLSWLSHIRPMPVGSHVLKEVWGNVKWSLSSLPNENEHLLDYLVGRDFGRGDGWMNLQFDCECVGLELEDWIFDDLLDELVFEDDPTGFVFR